MRIKDLIKLIDGKLLNFPSVSFIDQIKTDAKRIKRADAFLCLNKNDLNVALSNGAYAIIYTDDFDIIDNEIAWIKVKNIEKTIIRYLRYKTIQTSFEIFYADDITFQMLKNIVCNKSVVFLDNNIFDNFTKTINAENNSVFISNNKDFLCGIYPAFKYIEKSYINHITLIRYSLFKSDFIIDNIYYKDIKIPKIFLYLLNDAINFLKSKEITYNIVNIQLHHHFEPVFIDVNLNIKEFGTTNRVLIVEKNLNLINKEINYLNTLAKYAKYCLLLPKNNTVFDSSIDTIFYDNLNNILKIKRKNYNFFLILQTEKDDIFNFIREKQKNSINTLF